MSSRCRVPYGLACDFHTQPLGEWENYIWLYQFNIAEIYWRKVQGIEENCSSPCNFDRFWGQCTEAVLKLLEQNNILIAVVLANCTDRLQPLDVSVNKAVKEFLCAKFQSWYSDQICKKVSEGGADNLVDVRMSVVKPLGAHWLIELYEHMKSKPEIIVSGFRGSGITTI